MLDSESIDPNQTCFCLPNEKWHQPFSSTYLPVLRDMLMGEAKVVREQIYNLTCIIIISLDPCPCLHPVSVTCVYLYLYPYPYPYLAGVLLIL